MTAPVRLRLSRRKGFDLQTHSREVNGLPAVNVARPSRWGNQIVVGSDRGVGYAPWTAAEAVQQHREDLEHDVDPDKPSGELPLDLSPLRGRNLACWCATEAPCHADVLLDLANRPTCEVA